MIEPPEFFEGKTCVKCPEPAKYAGVDAKKAVYCSPCFIQMVRNKFRTPLTKRRIFRDGEARESLVVLDGSTASCFLLHQIEDALKLLNFKRWLIIEPTIVVLVSSLEESSIDFVKERVAQLKEVLPATVPWITVHLAAGLGKEPIGEGNRCHGVENIPRLKELLTACRTPTAKEEVKRILREKTLSLVARSTGISKIMLPDNGDALGRLSLAQLCLGRGGTISEMTSSLEKRPSGVSFIRPLKDISDKELAIVCRVEGYEKSAIRTNEPQLTHAAGSIQGITSDFVDNLFAEGFKATISTVMSTASKLHSLPPEVLCPLCELANVDAGTDLCSCCNDLLKEVDNPQLIRDYLL